MNVQQSIEITNHVKAGNINEATSIIDSMSKFDKLTMQSRLKKLLKRSSRLSTNDLDAMQTKLRLVNESL